MTKCSQANTDALSISLGYDAEVVDYAITHHKTKPCLKVRTMHQLDSCSETHNRKLYMTHLSPIKLDSILMPFELSGTCAWGSGRAADESVATVAERSVSFIWIDEF